MSDNKPLDEKEQAQLIEIMQIFMDLPDRDIIDLRFYADTSGSLHKDGTSRVSDEIILHFHDLEEGVALMRAYANPEQEEEEDNPLELDPELNSALRALQKDAGLREIDNPRDILFLPQDRTLG